MKKLLAAILFALAPIGAHAETCETSDAYHAYLDSLVAKGDKVKVTDLAGAAAVKALADTIGLLGVPKFDVNQMALVEVVQIDTPDHGSMADYYVFLRFVDAAGCSLGGAHFPRGELAFPQSSKS